MTWPPTRTVLNQIVLGFIFINRNWRSSCVKVIKIYISSLTFFLRPRLLLVTCISVRPYWGGIDNVDTGKQLFMLAYIIPQGHLSQTISYLDPDEDLWQWQAILPPPSTHLVCSTKTPTGSTNEKHRVATERRSGGEAEEHRSKVPKAAALCQISRCRREKDGDKCVCVWHTNHMVACG